MHRGPEAGVLRYHLALIVPEPDERERSLKREGENGGEGERGSSSYQVEGRTRDSAGSFQLGVATLDDHIAAVEARPGPLPWLHFGLCRSTEGFDPNRIDEVNENRWHVLSRPHSLATTRYASPTAWHMLPATARHRPHDPPTPS